MAKHPAIRVDKSRYRDWCASINTKIRLKPDPSDPPGLTWTDFLPYVPCTLAEWHDVPEALVRAHWICSSKLITDFFRPGKQIPCHTWLWTQAFPGTYSNRLRRGCDEVQCVNPWHHEPYGSRHLAPDKRLALRPTYRIRRKGRSIAEYMFDKINGPGAAPAGGGASVGSGASTGSDVGVGSDVGEDELRITMISIIERKIDILGCNTMAALMEQMDAGGVSEEEVRAVLPHIDPMVLKKLRDFTPPKSV